MHVQIHTAGLSRTYDVVKHDVGGIIAGKLVVSTEYPQFGRVFKRMLLIAQLVQ